MSMVKEIGEFRWAGDRQSWIDRDLLPVSQEKNRELDQESARLHKKYVLERLAVADDVFKDMDNNQERKAAHEWLRETYTL